MNHALLTLPDGQHTYSRGSSMLMEMAHNFGVEVDEQQHDEWAATLGTIYKLDTILDSDLPKPERLGRFDALLGDVIEPGAEADCTLVPCALCQTSGHYQSWDVAKQADFASNFEALKNSAEQRRATTTYRTLGTVTLLDGAIAARLISIPAEQNSMEARFNRWLGYLGEAGAIIDTAIDLREDFERGLTQVRPTVFNRAGLIAMGLPVTEKALRGMPLRTASLIGRNMLDLYRDKDKDHLIKAAQVFN